MKDCPYCKYWRELSEKATAHAMTYGPKLADMQLELQKFREDAIKKFPKILAKLAE